MTEENEYQSPISSGFRSNESDLAGAQVSLPCRCHRCSIVRWYPPLILASTALAAVFFWMYITKPVVSSTPMPGPVSREPVARDPAPKPGNDKRSEVALRTTLDPEISALPGDARKQTEGPDQDELTEDLLRPLIIGRKGPSLFRRIAPDTIPRKAAESEPPGVSIPRPGIEEFEVRAGTPPGNEPASDSDTTSGRSSDSGDLRVHASLTGEFLAPENRREKNM